MTSLYLSGGQVKNAVMMQLFADTCGIPLVLPTNGGEAVVLGAAMLGRVASEGVTAAEGMWRIMVSTEHLDHYLYLLTFCFLQVEMTPPATLVTPAASAKVKQTLNAKYKIFLEMIDIQKRWRKQMEEAAR